ncbi:mitochondrial cardiolipin hydrolase-like [Oppia nitens]|uniref:mitochondrial cardiolipin hydrolase-like n=1 Tax=Oppia nitens TaxID=1686743 RepID=UPI0023DAEF52|nr:mitochondrial cardiolipin hydrolase-like [Oppia nitens]
MVIADDKDPHKKMPQMSTTITYDVYYNIIVYITIIFICYMIRVYISYLLANNNNKVVKQVNNNCTTDDDDDDDGGVVVDNNDDNNNNNTVLFVPNIDSVHANSDGDNDNCRLLAKDLVIGKLLSTLKSAKQSVDICVYSISLSKLIAECIRLHRTGVRIRVITNDFSLRHNDQSFGYQLTNTYEIEKKSSKVFTRNGIQVKQLRAIRSGYMHNKFAIVDNNILINGSFNWTANGLNNNYEDMIITNEPNLVTIYSKQFNQYWDSM